MKVKFDYEAKIKIQEVVDLDELFPSYEYDEFVEEFEEGIDDAIKRLLANEITGRKNITLERISLNFDKIE